MPSNASSDQPGRLEGISGSERSDDFSDSTRTPPIDTLLGDRRLNNKNNVTTEGGSGSKHRRISLMGDMSTSSIQSSSPNRRRLSANEVPCESLDPIAIEYPEGLPSILFDGALMSDNAEEVVEATIKLKSVLRTGNGQDNAKQFVALGGHALLVTVMKKWETHPVIQYRLCASMADFTYHYPNSKSRKMNVFAALVQMGGMDLIVGAMARYAKVESFQYTCMLTIGNLCTDVGRQCMHNHAELFVHKLNGITLICNAMKLYSTNQTIQQTGTWLLEVLCALGMSQAPAMKTEALAVVALAVSSFPDNHDLAADARAFMNKVVN